MITWKTIVSAKIIKNTQTSFIVAFGDKLYENLRNIEIYYLYWIILKNLF